MPEPRRRSGSVLLNTLLLVLGLGVLLLGWGLVTRFTASTTAPGRADEASPQAVPSVIQVEVRNGSGISGLAARTLTFLRNEGFDVVQVRSEEHTSELQSRGHLVCRLLLEKKNTNHGRAVCAGCM